MVVITVKERTVSGCDGEKKEDYFVAGIMKVMRMSVCG